MPSVHEVCTRHAHLTQMGWTTQAISRELASMRGLERKNNTPTNSLAVSLDYCFTYLEPGDVLWVGDWLTVCQPESAA